MNRIFISSFILFVLLGCDNNKVIDGYLNNTSFIVGETCDVYLNSNDKGLTNVDIFDIEGVIIDKFSCELSQQKASNFEPWKNGFGYDLSCQHKIPKLASGIYLIDNQIPFVVKSKSKNNDITFVYPINTLNAYCNSGGKSLYAENSSDNKNAEIVSYLRPINAFDEFIDKEFLVWLKKQEIKSNYISDIDLDNYDSFKNSKILIIAGHNEYWTRQARINFDKFILNGGHAIIMSGNTMWWQVRYSENKQMICHRDNKKDSSIYDSLKTIIWSDTLLKYPIVNSIGLNFNYGGYGMKEDSGWNGYRIIKANSPLFENTNLKNGEILSLPTKEYDGVPNIGFDKNNNPIIDSSKLNFHKYELLGYDLGFRYQKTAGCFFVFQKNSNSGIVINTGSTNWCSKEFTQGKNAKEIQQITENMINKLLNNDSIFSN